MPDPLICDDPQAERRWSYGRLLANDLDWAAAAEVFEQCLERAPGFAPAWSDLGKAYEKTGDTSRAAACYAKALALDPDDRLGAGARIERLRGVAGPKLAAAYVARLFDDYADRFDRHIREDLHYSAPELIEEVLSGLGRRYARALDLGCGTGLAGASVRSFADRLEGVDLSPKMIAQAERRGVYDSLFVDEAVAFLQAADAGRYDCVVAADVLVYLGDLRPLFGAAARAMARGAPFVFTVENFWTGEGFELAETMRFRHSRGYLEEEAKASGFAALDIKPRATRVERGQPVPCLLAVLTRL